MKKAHRFPLSDRPNGLNLTRVQPNLQAPASFSPANFSFLVTLSIFFMLKLLQSLIQPLYFVNSVTLLVDRTGLKFCTLFRL
ncbi:hypothetical protein QYF36_016811 [Acer negundo]|nr:hypothetical protein QYF36_016811 [Acer negundo]